jgi:very-short-patch-repair endonuclease
MGGSKKGRKFSDAARNNMSVAHKGIKFTEEHKKRISEAQRGEKNHMYGKTRSEAAKAKTSASLKGRPSGMKGKHHTSEHNEYMRQLFKGENAPWYNKHLPEEAKEKLRIFRTGKKDSPETRLKKSLSRKGKTLWNAGKRGVFSKEANLIRSEKSKAMWADPEQRNKIAMSQNIRPNKMELSLHSIIDSLLPNQYVFTGDFRLWIGNKNPDFICEAKKKIIEFYGDHWHEEWRTGISIEEEEQTRIEHFKKHGYHCLVIWGHELKDLESLKAKLITFHNS